MTSRDTGVDEQVYTIEASNPSVAQGVAPVEDLESSQDRVFDQETDHEGEPAASRTPMLHVDDEDNEPEGPASNDTIDHGG